MSLKVKIIQSETQTMCTFVEEGLEGYKHVTLQLIAIIFLMNRKYEELKK